MKTAIDMIKFFRHIRKSLLEQNKTGKYFKYAIGEIILVVIGILIALQINNWNENKKDNVYEHKMLSEIKVALEGDIKHCKWMVERMNRLDSSANVMAQHIIDKSVFVDSLYLDKTQKRTYYLTTGTSTQFNRGPFDALKSSGIEKVRNDSLRKHLIYLYDFDIPRQSRLIKWVERDYEKQINKMISFLGSTIVKKHKDHYDYIKKFPKDLFQNPEFANLLSDIHRRAYAVRGNFKGASRKLQELLTHIETELEND